MIASIGFTFALIVFAITGLGISVLSGRPPLRGSCGGLACVKNVKCAGCPRAKVDGDDR